MARAYEGACFCGEVRFTVSAEPLYACHCHCLSCQRAVGAPFVTWATFPAAEFRVTDGSITSYHSSPGVTRGFCGRCGSSLSYTHVDRRGEIDLTVTSLAEPARIAPQSHIWVQDMAPWLAMDDGLPQFPQKVVG